MGEYPGNKEELAAGKGKDQKIQLISHTTKGFL